MIEAVCNSLVNATVNVPFDTGSTYCVVKYVSMLQTLVCM